MEDLAAWWVALPVVLTALAWCLLPGLGVTYAAGLRGVTAWGLAPAVSISVVAAAAVLASGLGVRWSVWAALVPTLVLVALVVGVRSGAGALRRRREAAPPRPAPPDGPRVALAAVVGSVVAAVAGAQTVITGIGPPSALSQTYDAVFHYSAVAAILAGGDGSSLTLGTLTAPDAQVAFYPAAWHDLVSLVVLTAGAGVPVAVNATAGVVAAVVWPLSCLVLVRTLAGPAWAAIGMTPVVALGFVAFPWALLGFGVLWPNLVGISLIPAALALVAAACRPEPTPARRHAPWLLPVVAVGLGLGHPNAVFSLGLLAVPPLAWGLALLLRRQVRDGYRVAPATLLLATIGGATAVGWFLLTSSVFDDVRAFDWPAYTDPLGAVREAVWGGTNRAADDRALGVAVLVGVVAALRVGRQRWLVPAHLLSGALFVLAASTETDFTAAVTGLWYNDPFRLAAVLPVTGVPLAVLGITGVGTAAHALVRRSPLRRFLPARVGPGVLAAAVAATVTAATGGMYAEQHAGAISPTYPPGTPLVDPAERAFFTEVAAIVPPGDVVAQNPWSGSPLLWALTGREVLFPHLTGNWTSEQAVLADGLIDRVPGVCAAAEELDVGWLLVGEADFWLGDGRALGFPGLDAPAPGTPGFALRASDRFGNRLYEITFC